MSSQTGTGTVVASTWSRRRLGAVSSLRGKEYLNWPSGENDDDGLVDLTLGEILLGDEEEGVSVIGWGFDEAVVLQDPGDLDHKASIAGDTTFSATEVVWGSG